MRVVTDSSALAKRYIQEPGSRRLAEFLAKASLLAVNVILVPEIVSALNRLAREHALSQSDYHRLKQRFFADIESMVILQITPETIDQSILFLENNTLRAMDALHVASALLWNADLFLTADRRQWRAAQQVGLQTIWLGDA